MQTVEISLSNEIFSLYSLSDRRAITSSASSDMAIENIVSAEFELCSSLLPRILNIGFDLGKRSESTMSPVLSVVVSSCRLRLLFVEHEYRLSPVARLGDPVESLESHGECCACLTQRIQLFHQTVKKSTTPESIHYRKLVGPHITGPEATDYTTMLTLASMVGGPVVQIGCMLTESVVGERKDTVGTGGRMVILVHPL